MTAELTAEQIVTNLLASNEILQPKKELHFTSDKSHNLGEYLSNKSFIRFKVSVLNANSVI